MSESRPPFPPWVNLETKVESVEAVGEVLPVAEALWKDLAAQTWVRSCNYNPAPAMGKVILGVEPVGDHASAEIINRLEDLAGRHPPPTKGNFWSVSPYDTFRLPGFGDASFAHAFSLVHHANSEAYFKFCDLGGESAKWLFSFAIDSTLALLDAFNPTVAEREGILALQIQILKNDLRMGPGDSVWEDAVALMGKKYREFATCVQEYRMDRKKLQTWLSAPEVEILRQQASAFQAALAKFSLEPRPDWKFSMQHLVVKRLIHLIWLRTFMDNYKESVCLGWLIKTNALTGSR